MKGKLLIILSGVALLHLFMLGGIALTGGCSSSDDESPVNGQNYVPAPAAETAQPSGPASPATTEFVEPAAPTTAALTPAPAPTYSEPKALPPSKPAELVKYTVQPGDSLWKISKKYGVSVDEIASYNQITSTKGLKVGQTISIPPGGRAYEAGEKASEKAAASKKLAPAKKAVGTPAPAPKAPAKAEKSEKAEKAETHAVSGAGESYAVQKGDTLDKIAKKFHVKAADIATASNISVDKMLQIGQKLTIPKAGAASAPAKGEKAEKTEKSEKSEKGKDAAKKGHASEKADEKSSEAKPAAKPAKTGDPLLDDIPSPDEGSAAPTTGDSSVKPLASSAAVSSAASVAGEKPVASSGYTAEVDQDTTIEKLATQYGCKAEDIKKLNPELPADGKIKAPTVVKIP